MSSLTNPGTPPALLSWWNAQKARPNYGEVAQAALRVAIGVVLMSAYYAWVDWSQQTWVRYLCWAFVSLSFVLFVWIYRAKGSSDFVRFLTLAVDIGTPTILLGGRKNDAITPKVARNRWACPADLNLRIRRPRSRVGWCELSARLLARMS